MIKDSGLFQNATIPIIGVNIVMFILQLTIDRFTDMFMLLSQDALSRPWILLTSMFLHGSPTHLMMNMYVLMMFGGLIEQKIGTKRFLVVYFGSGLLASLVFAIFQPSQAAVGASGAIMGILGLTIMLMPHLKILFLFVIPMSLRTAGIIFVIIDVFGAFGIGIPGIANVAHLGGLAFGLIFGFYLLKQKKSFLKRFNKPRKTITRHHINNTSKNIEMSDKEIDDYIKNGRL